MRKTGATLNDILLYQAVHRFDLGRVEELLKQGANPDISLGEDEDDDVSSCSRVDSEFCYFSLMATGLYESAFRENRFEEVDYPAAYELIGWAAYKKMYELLDSYSK